MIYWTHRFYCSRTADTIPSRLAALSAWRREKALPCYRGVYHAFWAEKGYGPVLIGEVSQCNDDTTDNHFYEPVGRFPTIEEDEVPLRLLCNEYPAMKGKAK